MSGQSVIDRLQAAKHSITGQGLAKSVHKATTEEAIGPKRKHLDYLLMCTNEPNVSIPNLASLLIQRTQSGSWVVTFKSLITIHNLMNYGNERFYQYLASNNTTLSLEQFVDKSNPQGFDMSTFIRKYAKYTHEKAVSYRQMAYDFCKVKRGKTDGLLRTMPWDKLTTAMGVLQHQIDTLLGFDATANDLTNGVINAAFMLLFKDLIRLFACYNDGVINLLEKYFDLNKKQCRDALDIYKRFLVRTDNTADFLKIAESMGIDKGDIPDLTKAPASLLEALEQHLASLEGKKGAISRPGVIATALKAKGAVQMSEEEKRRIIEEETKELNKLKEQKHQQELAAAAAGVSVAAPAPVASQPAAPVAVTNQSGAVTAATPSAAQDLLGLEENPFQAKVQSVMAVQSMSTNNSMGNMAGFSPTPQTAPAGGFTGSNGFAAAFGAPPAAATPQGDLFGDVLQPQNKPPEAGSKPLVQGDLDSSLASLAGNLSVNPAQNKKGNLQWKPPTEKKLTGGSNFQGVAPSTGASWNVMPGPGAAPMVAPAGNPYMGAPMGAGFQPTPAFGGAPPMYYGAAGPAVGGMGAPMMQQPVAAPGMMGQPVPFSMQPAGQPMRPQQPSNAPADPFGAL